MAVLKSKQRKALDSSEFAIPSKRAYPIDTHNRAANAEARVSQFGTPAEKSEVTAHVHAKYPEMGKDKSGKKSK